MALYTKPNKILLPFFDLKKSLREFSIISKSDIVENMGTAVTIDSLNWPEYEYVPEVKLFAGYTEDKIWLKYYVNEAYIRGIHTTLDSPVYTDSCVEFFVTSGNGFYYNFEFNCIGTVHAAYGTEREGRKLLGSNKASLINTYSTLGRDPFLLRESKGPWSLTAAIPFEIFIEPEFKAPRDRVFRGNFYKCGDELPLPHYLSWNPIRIKTPDFHRKDFFGEIIFI